jgi:hypothetical protein
MSNRSMLEFNHDLTPGRLTDEARQEWLASMLSYFSSGDPKYLPEGVTWFGMRHHTQDCPLVPPRGWNNWDTSSQPRSK